MKSLSFYLNWNGKRKYQMFGCPKCYMQHIKSPLLFEYGSINNTHSPFFFIPNASGTVKFFIDALHRNSNEEAMGYISKFSLGYINMEEVRDMFQNIQKSQYIIGSDCDLKKEMLHSVSVIVNGNNGVIEFIQLQMIKEPNRFGNWKIIDIKKVK